MEKSIWCERIPGPVFFEEEIPVKKDEEENDFQKEIYD